jgi:hypothetical protein
MITSLPGTVEEVLEQLGITIISVGSQEISASCPFHDDRHPSFSANATSGLWICYQCGESGTLPMLVDRVSKGTMHPDVLLKELRRKTVRKPIIVEPPPIDYRALQAEYEACKDVPSWALEERGFDRDIANEFGIRWDRGWVIPIWSPGRELWGWQFKRLDVVLNYPTSVKKSRTLFGLRELGPGDTAAALVESPLDVCKLAYEGVPAVASYGAMVSRDQLGLIVDHLDRVIITLDNDEEGNRQGEKVWCHLAKLMPATRATRLKGVKDPGDMTARQIEEVFSDIQG